MARMSLWSGEREAQVIQIGRAHTMGDTIVWLPKEKVLFAGDTIEFGAAPYCGDAHFTDWPETIRRLRELGAEKMVPGRGRALMTRNDVEEALAGTEAFTSTLFDIAKEGVAKGLDLRAIYRDAMDQMRPRFGQWVIFEHCMPFNVSRAFDEASGIDRPRIWTAERDQEMWQRAGRLIRAKRALATVRLPRSAGTRRSGRPIQGGGGRGRTCRPDRGTRPGASAGSPWCCWTRTTR